MKKNPWPRRWAVGVAILFCLPLPSVWIGATPWSTLPAFPWFIMGWYKPEWLGGESLGEFQPWILGLMTIGSLGAVSRYLLLFSLLMTWYLFNVLISLQFLAVYDGHS